MPIESKELGRVLSNPGNVILSDSLHDLLEDDVGELSALDSSDVSNTTDNIMIFFGEETFACKIEKIIRRDASGKSSDSVFVFVLFAPSLLIDVILDRRECVLEVGEYKFRQLDHSSIKWENNHLTIKARRILK